MEANETVPVYRPGDPIEGAAIQQALDDEGIWSHLEGEHQASLLGRWSARLLVRVEDRERARQIIERGSWPTAG